MIYSALKKIVFLLLFIISISSCSDLDHHEEFYGEWKSTVCENNNSSSFVRSFKEYKHVSSRIIDVWNQSNCPAGITPVTYVIVTHFFYQYRSSINVSAICKNGKATKRKVSSIYLAIDGKFVLKNKLENILEDEKKIRKIILSDIGNIVPKYDLICLDDTGKLRIGDISTGDGSTEKKYPKEINPVISFLKQ